MQLFNGYKMIQLYTHASDTSNTGEPVIYFLIRRFIFLN
jgi:hypothetical protein